MARLFHAFFALAGVTLLAADVGCAEPFAEQPPIHPGVFSLVICWPSDTQQPVVSEINLDAVRENRNQFDDSTVTTQGEWTVSHRAKAKGFDRYRKIKEDDGRTTVEYQSNDGGTYTSAATIEFRVERRMFRQNGKPVGRRVLQVLAVDSQ